MATPVTGSPVQLQAIREVEAMRSLLFPARTIKPTCKLRSSRPSCVSKLSTFKERVSKPTRWQAGRVGFLVNAERTCYRQKGISAQPSFKPCTKVRGLEVPRAATPKPRSLSGLERVGRDLARLRCMNSERSAARTCAQPRQ